MIAKPVVAKDQTPAELQNIIQTVSGIILGKEESVKMILAAFLAKGHVLIEDMPGVGKTTLAKAIAKVLGLEFSRIQCTNDMLPSDILGVNVFHQQKNEFVFKQGPLFSELVLVDELNRATPKTQSALLQAMEERCVDIDGHKMQLPPQFLIIATQNPFEQVGVYQLPESQLDRFLFRFSLGFPDRAAEKKLLKENSEGKLTQNSIDHLKPLLDRTSIAKLQSAVSLVKVADPVLNYIQDLIQATRVGNHQGLSPRGGLALMRAAQAWAYLFGRNFVLPEDVQDIAVAVMSHRLSGHQESEKASAEICREILKNTPVRA